MQLVIDGLGNIQCLYGEAIDLCTLGRLSMARASFVEPNAEGQWTADLSPVEGPVLGPFDQRTKALAAEQAWLEVHWLPCGQRGFRSSLPSPAQSSEGGIPCALHVTLQEFCTILAALRFYENHLLGDPAIAMQWIEGIATNLGTVDALNAKAIDALCQRLNADP